MNSIYLYRMYQPVNPLLIRGLNPQPLPPRFVTRNVYIVGR